MDPVLANPNGSPTRRGGSRGGTKPPAGSDQRISTCGICSYGVFGGEAKTWGNGIGTPIGWNHTGCAEAASADA